jgi:hypothetical protein
MKKQSWFEVDRTGLRKLIEDKGPAAVVVELIQNAWDQNVTRVDITLRLQPGRPIAEITVQDDDPAGFATLDHSYTLFAESTKKGDPEKRGRFNLGEKLVLSLCTEATISSTTGTIRFDGTGRHRSGARRDRGSRFEGTLRLTREEYAAVEQLIDSLIPPASITTTFNGRTLEPRVPLAELTATLPTAEADGEGVLRRVTRTTSLRVYPRRADEAMIFEMGIPVVPTGDAYDVDIGQKVPLNFNRDNVPPAYLRTVRTAVLNAMHAHLTEDDANAPWVREAASDPRCSDSAITMVVAKRFGDRRVIADPSDTEGTKLAASQGYVVVHGGALSAGEWANAKRAQAIQPAGQVTPSPRVLAETGGSLDGTDPYEIPPERYSSAMQRLVVYASEASERLLGKPITVRLVNRYFWRPAHSKRFIAATYGYEQLTFNVPRVKITDRREVNRLLIHELAHDRSNDHLSEDYHDAQSDLGAELAELALERPDLLAPFDNGTSDSREVRA